MSNPVSIHLPARLQLLRSLPLPHKLGVLERLYGHSGANIGQMALYLAPLPGVELFAIEPLPSAADWLEECLAPFPDWLDIALGNLLALPAGSAT